MAHVGFIWELGEGLGHLTRMGPVAQALARRGHRVTAVLKDVTRAARFFPDMPVFQAPVQTDTHPAPPGYIPAACTYADILHNAGASSPERLDALVGAWSNLLDLLDLDAAVLDYCPVAQVAMRGRDTAVSLLGTGFVNPPDVTPLPDLRPWDNNNPQRLLTQEHRVRDRLNAHFDRRGVKAIDRLAAVYGESSATLLATFPEMDHYGEREGSAYFGTWGRVTGAVPRWPAGDGPKVFVYLKPIESLDAVLSELRLGGGPTIAYITGVPAHHLARHGRANMRFVSEPVDIARVAAECDLAVLNAGHGTTAAMLLTGRPVLLLPRNLEQRLLGERIAGAGAGLRANPRDASGVVGALRALRGDARYGAGAKRFAARHADHDPAAQIERAADVIEEGV